MKQSRNCGASSTDGQNKAQRRGAKLWVCVLQQCCLSWFKQPLFLSFAMMADHSCLGPTPCVVLAQLFMRQHAEGN